MDTVLLVETRGVTDAEVLLSRPELADLRRRWRAEQLHPLVFVAKNVRRLGSVLYERPNGVYLFNYFSAPSTAATLDAWQYTAGWFQDETGLDNSTVMEPMGSGAGPYPLINHCRWDRLRDVLPSLTVKPSFRTFVLKAFADHGVTPHPVLYRRHST